MSRLLELLSRNSVVVAFIGLFALFSVLSPQFATLNNIQNIAVQASVVAIVAVGMTFVILTAGIDLSVGAIVFLTAAIVAELASGTNPLLLSLLVILAGAAMGLVNGLAIGRFGISALIVTLATQNLYRGIAGRLTGLQRIPIPERLTTIGLGTLAGVPDPIYVVAGVALAGHFIYRWTVFGRYVQAIGSNHDAAVEMGLPVRRVIVGTYVLTGLFTAIAALVSIGQLGSVEPDTGIGLELTVITAVVLGGTSLFGGRGSILGSLLGAAILAVISNGLVLVGASPYLFDMIRAVVLIGAVGADALQRYALSGVALPPILQGFRRRSSSSAESLEPTG